MPFVKNILPAEARAALLTSGTAVTVAQFADATGTPTGMIHQRIARARTAGELVTVAVDGEILVPTVQLDATTFAFRGDVGAVVARLTGAGMDGWAVWDWFETSNGWLDRSPADAIATGDIDQVHQAIDGLFQ